MFRATGSYGQLMYPPPIGAIILGDLATILVQLILIEYYAATRAILGIQPERPYLIMCAFGISS